MSMAWGFLISTLMLVQPAYAASLSGSAERPFPALMPLDYPYCRAVAWIDALSKAEKNLGRYARARLGDMGMDDSLGRLALCAMACPIEAVTPELTASGSIQVFLRVPDPVAIKFALDHPERLALQMCLIYDMEKKINLLSMNWPRSLDEARARMADLTAWSESLDALWEGGESLDDKPMNVKKRHELAKQGRDSGALWLLAAIALERANLAQAAIQAADEGLKACDHPGSPIREALLAARLHFVRAIAHWRLDQPALAEVDLTAAQRLHEKSGLDTSLLPEALEASGEFYRARGNTTAMCENFTRACAMGQCHSLARARSRGECPPMKPAPGPPRGDLAAL